MMAGFASGSAEFPTHSSNEIDPSPPRPLFAPLPESVPSSVPDPVLPEPSVPESEDDPVEPEPSTLSELFPPEELPVSEPSSPVGDSEQAGHTANARTPSAT